MDLGSITLNLEDRLSPFLAGLILLGHNTKKNKGRIS